MSSALVNCQGRHVALVPGLLPKAVIFLVRRFVVLVRFF
jgi:hypothetical protein